MPDLLIRLISIHGNQKNQINHSPDPPILVSILAKIIPSNRRKLLFFLLWCNIGKNALSLICKPYFLELTVLPQPALRRGEDILIGRCLSGDMAAFGELYQRYSKAMFNTCLRLLNDRAEAEDVLQESFIEAFKNLEGFEYRTSFGGWLKQICVNRSINQLKKRKLVFIDIEKTEDRDWKEEPPFDENEIALQVETVKKAIMLLPDGYRTVLSLYLLEGYDHEEIAEILNVAESTTRTQYMRARQKLLQLLKEGS